MLRPPLRRLAAVLAAALAARAAAASPLEFLPVSDPLEAELRVLELYDPPAAGGRIALPHRDALPLLRLELMGSGPPPASFAGPRGIALARIERALARDATAGFPAAAVPGATPRLVQRAWRDDERLELSAGLEGEVDAAEAGGRWSDPQWADLSGLHLRLGAQVDHWLAYSHLALGELRGARRFTDALVAGTDVTASTDDSWLAYVDGTRWSVAAGRGHFQWGPGEEGSLLLSRTAAPLSALTLHARLAALRADGFVLHATVDPGRGEQLAAHRLEWQPADGVRLGVSEAARYHAAGWQGVYLVSVIPFSLAQRLLQEDSPDSAARVRNNVMLSADAAWRVADGVRVYGEALVDDLHAKSADVPDKLGFQLGLDGTGPVRATRVTWNAEYTWLSRYVYTSFFGEAFTAQDRPLGFPTGPDTRRLRLRVGWDPDVDWQLGATVSRTRAGAEGLGDPFVPGSPVPPLGSLAGVVERTDALEGLLRWWPAAGVDVSARLGWSRVRDAGHVSGAKADGATAAFAVRLTR
ncbi:MAG TPA: capsule assembly Wzi family protein [Candidatus Eisenbacteria bacterium]|nr:capsule assembly Wzi family protein [Candidatus Eisenbacteria bacterium]